MFGKEIVRLLWLEDSNTGSIFNADAEEDGVDNIEEDRKNDGNIEVPDTSLEKKKKEKEKQ